MASIRMATPEDAGSVSRVQVETWRTAYRGIVPDTYLAGLSIEQRTLRWREHLSSSDHVLVAECDGEVVGFITGGRIHEPLDSYDAELYAIYLLLEYQRTGMGTALLVRLAQRLYEVEFQSMAVWVFEANEAGRRFYEKSGGSRIGAKQREFGGVLLPLVAYGWPHIRDILASRRGQ